MKVAVMNFSGNVGKTTVAKHLIYPRLKGAEYIAVETINSDDGDSETVKGKQWGQLQEHLMTLDSAVVDIGASNVEAFVKLMHQYRGSHEEFDLFVIPTVKESKQLRDTLATLDALKAMGVPAKKIRVVFNMLETDDDWEDAFWGIISYHADKKNFELREGAVIYFSEIYHRLRQLGTSIEAVLNDKTDYRAKLKEAKSESEKQNAISMITAGRLAKSAKENLDSAYSAMIK
tara:strand:- start:1982 stop:2677 length:696 start_codon:yes stop_codon:yes gene_type:complete